jgi:hypothetical protein
MILLGQADVGLRSSPTPTEGWVQLWPDGSEELSTPNERPLRWWLARRLGSRTLGDGDRRGF